MKNVVTIGGGTGTFTVLSGLKKYDDLNISAIVTMADSGGSTGRLRDEFGYLPVGDVRMALAALAEDEGPNTVLRKLLLHRFDKGEKGLKGHNFGNLFLVALQDIFGSQRKAIERASRILRIKGNVIPVTKDDVHLVAQYEDGSIVKGETHIDEPLAKHDGTMRIKELSTEPKGEINHNAKKAIEQADFIILGPGDLYTSLIANLVVDEVAKVVKDAKAKIIYIVNLMTKYGQTYGFSAEDHIGEIEKYIGRSPDFILYNNSPLPKDVLEKYEQAKELPVEDDLEKEKRFKVIKKDLLADNKVKKKSGDKLKRSFIRHDSEKLANTLYKLIE